MGESESTTANWMVARSEAMVEVVRQVERLRHSEITVAIFGESGSGKEALARLIHEGSGRNKGPFVAINCAALPEASHESELFGIEHRNGEGPPHPGRFEQAAGGTLLLDEVAEVSALAQASLLRALQERKARRVGGTTEFQIDTRIICTTRHNLEAEVRAGRFREDLFFRLVAYPIHLSPLRDRVGDIPELAHRALRTFATDVGRTIERIAPEAMDALVRYTWPGNVRELQNVLHRALISSESEVIELQDLPLSISGLHSNERPLDQVIPLAELERRAIHHALRVTEGNVDQAAKLLGMGRATLYRRLSKFDKGNALY